MNPIFSDNMVLQQGANILVWGKADPEEKIEIKLQDANDAVVGGGTADKDGNWAIKLPARKAGTGYTLTVKGKNTVEFKNVAVGEVWICSGQSNMQWELWRLNKNDQGKKVAAEAKNPNSSPLHHAPAHSDHASG